MIRVDGKTGNPATNPYIRAWPALIAAWVLLGAAVVSSQTAGDRIPWLTVVLTGAAVLATGIAVAINPRSSLNLLLAGGSAIIAGLIAHDRQWDSAALAIFVLSGLALFAAGVVLLPMFYRRLVVSLVLLFHLGGLVAAVTSADRPWVSTQLWHYIYRPYLQFTYLNNAYHFYSPEPGPAPLMWFRIEYASDADGKRNVRWVKIPESDQNGKRLRPDGSRLWPNVEYTRRLSLAESINRPSMPQPMNLAALSRYRDQEIAKAKESNTKPLAWMPLLQDVPFGLEVQYQEPDDGARTLVAKYARHVASRYPHQEKPELPVVGVKVYKVIHIILPAQWLGAGVLPDDPEAFHPYFMGEFDKDGNMKLYAGTVRLTMPDGATRDLARDPLLYWLIPIFRRQQINSVPLPPATDMKSYTRMVEGTLKTPETNYLAIHAGDEEGK